MASRSLAPVLLAVAMLVVLGLLGWLLLGEGGAPGSGPEADGGRAAVADDLPPMQLTPAGRGESAERLVVEPDASAPAARPAPTASGPVRRVAGRLVRVSDGTPLTGVRVRALQDEARTDAQGAFELAAVGASERVLVISLPARDGQAELPDDDGDLSGLRLVVDSGWNVPGVLLSSAGGPVRGGSVRAGGGDWLDVDATGGFVLRDVQRLAGDRPTCVVAARGPWHALHEQRVSLPANGRVADPVELVLEGAGRIEGVVTSSGGERPDVREVRLAWRRDGVVVQPVTPELLDVPDAEDRYRVEHVPAGTYIVELAPTDLEFLVRSNALQARAARQAAGPREDGVQAAPREASQADLAVEQAARRAADPRAAPRLWIPDVEVRVGETTRLDVELPPGAVLRGRVTDGAGNPVPGAAVVARRVLAWDNPGADDSTHMAVWNEARLQAERDADGVHRTRMLAPLAEVETDAAGAWELGHLPPGELRLEIAGPDAGSLPVVSTLQLAPGEVRDGVDTVLGRGLSIGGRLVDPAGAAVAGLVALLPAEGPVAVGHDDLLSTDDQGRFEFSGLSAEPRRLWVRASGYRGVSERVEPGGAPLLVTLEPAPLLSGVVRDAYTYEPVTRFQVSVSTATSVARQTFESEEGRFVFDSLEDGVYQLEVRADGYELAERADVRPGFDARPLELLLTPLG